MLPLINWADQRLLNHLNPYGTMHVGTRVYDFPYLPGMLLAFLGAVAIHADLRWLTLLYVIGAVWLLYTASITCRRSEAAALIGAFVLSPFLQYLHDLYLQPHWVTLVFSVVSLRRKQFILAAAAFGLSMALYQLSWVLFPFIVLYALRRNGWWGAAKTTLISLGIMAFTWAPFLSSASQRIAHNTVGQWSRLPHALADPLNISYWLTFVVRPDHLEWVQLALLTALFAYCCIRVRCNTLTDTLRWMSVALVLFIALNVLVDGYFYLTALLLLLMFTLLRSGIWADPDEDFDSNGAVVIPSLSA